MRISEPMRLVGYLDPEGQNQETFLGRVRCRNLLRIINNKTVDRLKPNKKRQGTGKETS